MQAQQTEPEISVALESLNRLGMKTAQAFSSVRERSTVRENGFFRIVRRVRGFYDEVLLLTQKDVTLPLLFLAVAFLDLAALIVLYLIPSPPVSYIFAPIVRTFWGERFLHYPDNFLLLPKLMTHAHFVISLCFGVLITGIVIKKIEASLRNASLSILSAVQAVQRRFLPLLAAWLSTYFLFSFTLRAALPFLSKNPWIQLLAVYVFGLLFQSISIYVLPAMVISSRRFFARFAEGLAFGAQNLSLTAALLAAPVFMIILVFFSRLLTPVYIRIYPELVLWVLGLGIVLTTAVDYMVTLVTTTVFLKGRNET